LSNHLTVILSMISIALHIPPSAEFSQFTTHVNLNAISTISAFAIAPTEPAQAHSHKIVLANSCGMTSDKSRMEPVKRGIMSVKSGMTSIVSGMTSVKRGISSGESGMTSAKYGMASAKHGITINLSDF
jgi:hypothetical protein